MAALYIDTDHVISLSALTTEAGDLVTGALVQMTLLDLADGSEIDGQAWPVTLTEGAAGEYSAQLSADVDVDDDVRLRLTAQSGGRRSTWFSDRTVARREF